MAAKQPPKHYPHSYETKTQAVSKDGSTIRMENGHVFKRTVLPSIAEVKAERDVEYEKWAEEIEDTTPAND